MQRSRYVDVVVHSGLSQESYTGHQTTVVVVSNNSLQFTFIVVDENVQVLCLKQDLQNLMLMLVYCMCSRIPDNRHQR